MSNLATHEAEQAAITAAYEAQADREFAFDLKLFATVRVKAKDVATARNMLNEAFNCADANFGAWPNGDPITAEASIDGRAALIEIDGEAI